MKQKLCFDIYNFLKFPDCFLSFSNRRNVFTRKENLLGKFSFSLQILLHASTPIFLLLIFYYIGNFP